MTLMEAEKIWAAAEKLQRHARRIARALKELKRTDEPHVKVGICLGDKVITVALTWDTLESTSEEELIPVICAAMREEPMPKSRPEWEFPDWPQTAKEKGKHN